MASPEQRNREAQVADEVAEGAEADGVAQIEMRRSRPVGAEAAALDVETLAGLDDDERRALEEAARKAGMEAAGSVALSRNFVLAEFHCCRGHCADAAVPSAAVPALRRLVTHVLQPMRDQFGSCSVHSGYRNAAHNAHVRGEDRSHHRYDRRPRAPAVDVSFTRGTVEAWATEARRRLQTLGDIGGIGRYPAQGFVHVDLGAKRSWPTPGL